MFSPRVLVSYLSSKVSLFSRRCERASAVPAVRGGQTAKQGQCHRGFKWTASLMNLGERVAPTATDKRMLVWAKMYKTVEEVPKEVSYTKMRKARDLARIRVNIWMGVATLVACIVIIQYAKSRKGSGDSLKTRGLQWELDMQEKGKKERELKEQAEAEKAG